MPRELLVDLVEHPLDLALIADIGLNDEMPGIGDARAGGGGFRERSGIPRRRSRSP